MYGPPHLVAIAILLLIPAVMLLARSRLRSIPLDGPLIRGLSWFMLLDQVLLFVLYFVYDYQPVWERFPLHLCAWLSIFIPTMTLLGRIDAIRYVGVWAIGSGFMAVVNMSLAYNPVTSYVFFHYLWMHFYVFAFPIFLALRGEMRMNYIQFLQSMGGLVLLSAIVFLIDWVIGADYMYLGPNSTLEVPALPAAWREWPWSFPTFTAIGVVFLHLVYLALRPVAKRPA